MFQHCMNIIGILDGAIRLLYNRKDFQFLHKFDSQITQLQDYSQLFYYIRSWCVGKFSRILLRSRSTLRMKENWWKGKERPRRTWITLESPLLFTHIDNNAEIANPNLKTMLQIIKRSFNFSYFNYFFFLHSFQGTFFPFLLFLRALF